MITYKKRKGVGNGDERGLENCIEDEVVKGGLRMVALTFQWVQLVYGRINYTVTKQQALSEEPNLDSRPRGQAK